MPHAIFDRSRLKIQPLARRQHDLDLSILLPLDGPAAPFEHAALPVLGRRLAEARRRDTARILLMGAHVLRAGVQRQIIDLMERGLINHLAMNGAGPIHDWEFALIGASTESVARYIQTGEFGLWEETGRMNQVIASASSDIGLGEALGQAILDGTFPHKDISVLAAGVRLGIPVTVHVGIGHDIIHEHATCDGAALGRTSYRDFLILAQTVTRLEGGVLLNYGSAVMGPEVYLKALSMARNVARQEGRHIRRFTTAVFDLIPLDDVDPRSQAPRSDPRYYYRPWKTILVRTVADGGESFYIQGDHRLTFPRLRQEAIAATELEAR